MDLIHCIYSSAATNPDLSDEDLDAILEQSRLNNEKADITGILLFDSGAFFQVLEGDKSVVDKVYKVIETDKRHRQVTKLISESIEEREFGEWTMGYPRVTRKELGELPGFNDFFSKGLSFRDLEKSRAKQLLAAFKNGKWRAAVTG